MSLVGDAIFLVALAWQTYELSNARRRSAGSSAAYVTPMVVFLLAGGVLTDRVERRKLMIAADVIRALAIGAAGALAVSGDARALAARGLRGRDGRRRRAVRAGVRLDRAGDRPARAARAGERARPVRAAGRRASLGPAVAGVLIARVGRGARARRRRRDLRRVDRDRAAADPAAVRAPAGPLGVARPRARASASCARGPGSGRRSLIAGAAQRRARRAQRPAAVRGQERPARVGRRARRGLLGDRRRRARRRRSRTASAACRAASCS